MNSPKAKLDPSRQSAATHLTRENSNQAVSPTSIDDISLSSEADTIRLVALEYNEKLSIDEGPVDPAAAPFDPYNNASTRSLDNRPRRSIDDMRKLSAEITKAKHYSPKRR